MNQRFASVLIFAFVVATGASLLLYRLLAHRVETKPAVVTRQIVVAARDLQPGTQLKDQDLKLEAWAGALPAGSAGDKKAVIGRGVLSPIFINEPILGTRLADEGAGAGLASMIPKGMRAVAVRVNDVVGVGGFVVPGMRVDVLISGNPPNADGRLGSLTKTLLQNIEVLSAGQDYRRDTEGKPQLVPVVNLLVTPEQAEKLSLAAAQTTLQFVLRNPMDTKTAETPGTALAQLFGARLAPAMEARPRPEPRAAVKPAPEPAPILAAHGIPASGPPSPSPFVVETIHSGHRAETRFKPEESK